MSTPDSKPKNNQYKIDKESEEAFRDWLESIVFVDKNGNVLPIEEVENADIKIQSRDNRKL